LACSALSRPCALFPVTSQAAQPSVPSARHNCGCVLDSVSAPPESGLRPVQSTDHTDRAATAVLFSMLTINGSKPARRRIVADRNAVVDAADHALSRRRDAGIEARSGVRFPHRVGYANPRLHEGRDFPIARIAYRLRCPRCGCRRGSVMFSPPSTYGGMKAASGAWG
jgi:hypothetical protein